MCHIYVRADGLAGVLIADHEYPQRVAHTLLTKVLKTICSKISSHCTHCTHCTRYQILDDFSSRVESSLWTEGNAACAAYQGLESSLAKYQNPREADALTKVQEELDETKIILVSIGYKKKATNAFLHKSS